MFDSTLSMGGEMFSDEQSRRTALAPLIRYNPACSNKFQTSNKSKPLEYLRELDDIDMGFIADHCLVLSEAQWPYG